MLIEKRLTILAIILGTAIGFSFSLSSFWYDPASFFTNLTTELVGIGFTFILLELYLKYEERKKWRTINLKVKEMFNILIKELLLDISFMCGLIQSTPNDIEFDESKDDLYLINKIFQKYDKKLINIINTLSSNRKFIEESLNIATVSYYGERMRKHYTLFNNFEIKYSLHLEPDVLLNIIGIELELKNLTTDIENIEYRASDKLFLFALSFYIQRIMKHTQNLIDLNFLEFKARADINEKSSELSIESYINNLKKIFFK